MNYSYKILRLIISNYRSYEKLKFETNSKKNIVITGPNGAGKTNILESISLFSMSGPFRKAKFDDLGNTKANDKTFTISLKLQSKDDIHTLGMEHNYGEVKNDYDENSEELPKTRTIIANENNITPSDLQNYIKIIWLTPFMDRLFSESITERRKFLDNLISNFYPVYWTALNTYTNLLKGRAKLLKSKTYNENWINSIETELVSNALVIADFRLEFEDKLNQILKTGNAGFPKLTIQITGFIEDNLRQYKSYEVEELFKNNLKQNRELFKIQFSPSVDGPHRSDFTAMNLDKNILATHTSTGEQKCAVISIILAYTQMLHLYFDTYPLLLIDEAPAHLDNQKLTTLFEILNNLPIQIWFTGIDDADFSKLNVNDTLYITLPNKDFK